MSIDFLLLSCLKFKLKKRDKNVLNAKKSKSADFTVLFFSLIFETCFPFPDVRNLHDWTELVWYFIEECCWSGTDLCTNVKALYYTHHLRVCTREPSVWNHVFTVNIDLFEVARNVCGFVLRSTCNRRKCQNNSIGLFEESLRR